MDELPPPPPRDPYLDVPIPRPAPARRPGVVTGAAIVLIVAGVLTLVGALVVMNSRGTLKLPGLDAGDAARWIAAVTFVVGGALNLVAGWLVLRLSPSGRVLGIVVALLGIVQGLALLSSSGPSGLLTIFLDAFVLYALFTYGFVFKGGQAGR